MYNMTQKAALEWSAKKRDDESLTAGQEVELVERKLDALGLKDPLSRARMRMRKDFESLMAPNYTERVLRVSK